MNSVSVALIQDLRTRQGRDWQGEWWCGLGPIRGSGFGPRRTSLDRTSSSSSLAFFKAGSMSGGLPGLRFLLMVLAMGSSRYTPCCYILPHLDGTVKNQSCHALQKRCGCRIHTGALAQQSHLPFVQHVFVNEYTFLINVCIIKDGLLVVQKVPQYKKSF